MGARDDRMLLVRAELCARIDRLSADLPRLTTDQIVSRAQVILRSARSHGLSPLERVAHGLVDALGGSGGRGALSRPYVEAMRDAVGCDRLDAAAGDTYLAAVAVRLAG